jgi:hypothetical protein
VTRDLPADINGRVKILSQLRPKWGRVIDEEIEAIRKDDEALAEAQGITDVREEFAGAPARRDDAEGNALTPNVIDIGSPHIEQPR